MKSHQICYQVPKLCLIIIGLGVFLVLFGVAHVAHADEMSNTGNHFRYSFGTRPITAEDQCDVCIWNENISLEEDYLQKQIAEATLHNALKSVVGFTVENNFYQDDLRLNHITKQLTSARFLIHQGDYDTAIQMIEAANQRLDLLNIEARHTDLRQNSGNRQHTFIAIIQSNSESRSISVLNLSDQPRLLPNIDNSNSNLATKRQMVFTVRIQHVIHRRVPLSDEEASFMFHFAYLTQRSSSSNVRSLFYFTRRLGRERFVTLRQHNLTVVVHQTQPSL